MLPGTDTDNNFTKASLTHSCYINMHLLIRLSHYTYMYLLFPFLYIGIFGELKKLSVDSSGLMYHCDEYGVTLIIPEGAIRQPATVWFGACLYNAKFKFGDYVPVTPIVWIYIDQKLHKLAELYFPHDIIISSEADSHQLTVLKANDNECSSTIIFQQNNNTKVMVEPDSQIFKIDCLHFCSNCVAIHKKKYKSIARQYLLARAEKRMGTKELLIEFIFLCQQKGCKKVKYSYIFQHRNLIFYNRLLKVSVPRKTSQYYLMKQSHLLVMARHHFLLSQIVFLVGKGEALVFAETL